MSTEGAEVLAIISAAVTFVHTDAAFGPDDPRAQRAKARLAQAVAEGTSGNVIDLPQRPHLHVIQGGQP